MKKNFLPVIAAAFFIIFTGCSSSSSHSDSDDYRVDNSDTMGGDSLDDTDLILETPNFDKVKEVLSELEADIEKVKYFKKSLTPPAEGTDTLYLDVQNTIPVWYDSSSCTIYYYNLDAQGKEMQIELETGEELFAFYRGIYEIDLNVFNFSNAKSLHQIFESCNTLTSLTFPENINTSKVIDMSYMFHCCENLSSISFPESFDTGSVCDMQVMFGECEKLSSLDLSMFNTSKVFSMRDLFDECRNLAAITFPENFGTRNVTHMGGMFS